MKSKNEIFINISYSSAPTYKISVQRTFSSHSYCTFLSIRSSGIQGELNLDSAIEQEQWHKKFQHVQSSESTLIFQNNQLLQFKKISLS